ncbi:MAG TPA: GerMN domain-containing protein [Acidimicrobiia bacterium]
MRQSVKTRRLLVLATILGLILAACGDGVGGDTTGVTPATSSTLPATTSTAAPATTTTTTAATTTTTGADATGHVVYFLLEELDTEDGSPGPFLVPVYRETSESGEEAELAIRLLLEGPSSDETEGTPSLSTAIPEGTSLLGITVEGGVGTVDLSGEYDDGGGSFAMFARLAQVVYTLTRLPGVERVAFTIDGEPVTVFSSEGIELEEPQERADYYDLLPPVFVDSPAWGEPVTSPVEVRGLSNVFEATSQVMLTDDDGLTLFEDHVTASCGTGCWGEWSVDIPYTLDREQFGALIVWELSARDGSQVNIREYPVILR